MKIGVLCSETKADAFPVLSSWAWVLPNQLCFGAVISSAPFCCFINIFHNVNWFWKHLGEHCSLTALAVTWRVTFVELGMKSLFLMPLKNKLFSHFLVLSTYLMLLPYFPILLVIHLHNCKNIQVSSYEFLNWSRAVRMVLGQKK